jgi:ketosteroid isomerase-like protein
VAGDTAAVAWALIRCAGRGSAGRDETLDVRLTIGLQRSDGVWRIVHEHHSVPAAIS